MEKVAPALEEPAVAAEQGTAGSEEEEAATEAATAKTVEGKVDANEVVTASGGGESGQANGADGQAQNAAATKIQARARGARWFWLRCGFGGFGCTLSDGQLGGTDSWEELGMCMQPCVFFPVSSS